MQPLSLTEFALKAVHGGSTLRIRDIPCEPGSLSILLDVSREPVQPPGNASSPVLGAKWSDIYTWAILYWEHGVLYTALLHSTQAHPYYLQDLRDHHTDRPGYWRKVSQNDGAPPCLR
jgi:hypothetical protein